MSDKTLDLRVRFLSDHIPSDALTPAPPFDQPPPWEPKFEDVLSLSPIPPIRRRPLDPPPSCFSVPSPLRIRSHDFPPFRILSVSDKLTDGFRLLYPQNILEKHGINRADWVRFLEDLGVAARLSNEGLKAVGSRVPVAPLLTHRIFSSRAFGSVYDARFARSPVEEVRALILIWNQCAFERRKIKVTLQVQAIGMTGRKSYALVIESL